MDVYANYKYRVGVYRNTDLKGELMASSTVIKIAAIAAVAVIAVSAVAVVLAINNNKEAMCYRTVTLSQLFNRVFYPKEFNLYKYYWSRLMDGELDRVPLSLPGMIAKFGDLKT